MHHPAHERGAADRSDGTGDEDRRIAPPACAGFGDRPGRRTERDCGEARTEQVQFAPA
jgi:hypothetical protein